MLLDAGPGPHVTAASNVDLHDAVKGVPPPERDRVKKNTYKGIIQYLVKEGLDP